MNYNDRNQHLTALYLAIALALPGCGGDHAADAVTTPAPQAAPPAVVPTEPVMSATLPTLTAVPPAVLDIGARRTLMDKDQDERVTPEEHAAGSNVLFTTMDDDGDGNVTSMEMDASEQALGAKRRTPSADRIKALDSNGDGMLSMEEHVANSRAMFDTMDADRNGDLTVAELQAGHDAIMAAEKK